MTASSWDQPCREAVRKQFAHIREAVAEARRNLKAEREKLDAEIEECFVELFGSSVKKCSAGGFAKAILSGALAACTRIDLVLAEEDESTENMLNGGW